MGRSPKTSRLGNGRSARQKKSWIPLGRRRISLRRVLGWSLMLGVGCLLIGGGLLAALCYHYIRDPLLPKIDHAGDYRPKVTTVVLDRNGQRIGEIFEERRTVVPYDQISPHLIHAIVDTEDAQFFVHRGINQRGILRALLHNLRPGTRKQGASTITQQLVKNYVLHSDERSLRRKVQEAYLAIHLEQVLSKEEILWIYLNHIYFGQGRYGIEEASQHYFGKSARDLDIGEAATLASLPKSPEGLAPKQDPASGVRSWPERMLERRNYVLSRMVDNGHISAAESKRFSSMAIPLAPPVDLVHLAPEFVDEVEAALKSRYTEAQIPYLGLRVRTTCDARIQRLAREALETGLQKMDERNGYRKAVRHITNDKQREKLIAQLTKQFPTRGPIGGRVIEGLVKQVFDGDGTSGAGAVVLLGNGKTGWLPLPTKKDRYNPKADLATARFRVDDTLRVRVLGEGKEGISLALENGPQGAVVVLDPHSRHVLAMVGGQGYERKYFNRALRARRQPGSAFKPFLYATALQTGRFTLASLVNDAPQVFDLPDLRAWKPHDHGGYLGPMRLRTALALSRNSVAASLIYNIQPQPVVELARKAGIQSELQPVYSLALGSSPVGVMELANAYATFASLGTYADPQLIVQIGEEAPLQHQITNTLSPELCFLVTSAMQSVIEEGTARAIKGKLKRPAAGKTGTTNKNNDAWFVGYTADLLAAVWIGFDDNHPLRSTDEGARAALPIWYEILSAAEQKRPAQEFHQPAGIVVAAIDPKTGLRATPGSPRIEEFFLEKTLPTQESLPPGETDPNTFFMQQSR